MFPDKWKGALTTEPFCWS